MKRLADADTVGGLTSAIGETVTDTLAGVRDRFIGEARRKDKVRLAQAADQLDYFVFRSLIERRGYALLAMGHNNEKGCFCPANMLLKKAVESLMQSFAGVLLDAEAGIEQINRDVTSGVTHVLVVVDASKRSMDTLALIESMVGASRIGVVANRVSEDTVLDLPDGVQWMGVIPENEALKQFDRAGRPLWQLPADNHAVVSVRQIARFIEWSKKD